MSFLLMLANLFGLHFLEDIYETQWVVIAILSSVAFAFAMKRYFRLPFSLLLAYLAGSAFLHSANLVDKVTIAAADMSFRQTIFVLIVALTLGRKSVLEQLPHWARAIAPAWFILTMVGLPPLWNYSCNAAFLVCLAPFMTTLWGVGMCFLPAAFQMGTTPLFIIGVLAAYTTLARRRWALLLLVPPFLAWAYTHPWRFDEHERWTFYARAIKYWWAHCDIWTGTGLGSFPVMGPVVQRAFQDLGPQWLSAHSDFVQVLFETGILGASLAVWVLVDTLVLLEERPRMALLALIAFGVFYFPLAIPIVVVWGLAVVASGQARL